MVEKNSKKPSTKKNAEIKPITEKAQKNHDKYYRLKQIGKILAYSLWALLVIIIIQIISALLVSAFSKDALKTPTGITVYSVISYTLSPLIIIYVPQKIFKKMKTSRSDLGLKGLPTFSDLGLAPVGLIVYLILAGVLTFLFNFFPWFDQSQAQDLGLSKFMSNPERILTFFSLVIIGPISEELIFRGWLYDKIRKTIPKKFSLPLSILIVSILFGLLHAQWNVGVNVFALSVVACLLREVTGTIYPSILLHILKNAIAFCLVYVIGIS